MQNEIEVFETCLRNRNLKNSQPRRDILEVFLASEGHLTAQELLEQAKQKNPRIGFATVYRTLKLLEECRLARSMDYGDGTQRYEPNRFQHHHIICTSCNRTVEFLSPELESLLQQVQKNHQFMPQTYAIRILSVCVDCEQMASKPGRRSVAPETVLSRDALRIAITNEQKGRSFYHRALQVTANEATRTIFSRLAAEEDEHLAALQKEYDALCEAYPWLDDEPALLYVDQERLDSIFSTHPFLQSVQPGEALYLAMLAEQRSYEFFQEYADKVEHPSGRTIFEQFAREEQRHLQLIRQAYDTMQGSRKGAGFAP